MASIRQIKSTGKWEAAFQAKDLFVGRKTINFPTERECRLRAAQIQDQLDMGLVPKELADGPKAPAERAQLRSVINEYLAEGRAPSTDTTLTLVAEEVGHIPLAALNTEWLDSYIRQLKVDAKHNLAPGTIRKRVGALKRAYMWFVRKHQDYNLPNPFQHLDDAYSTYNDTDAELAERNGGDARIDVERNRRLHPGEYERVVAALSGVKREDRERALKDEDGALLMLFQLIVWTGARLIEAYTMNVGQVDLERRSVTFKTSKQRKKRTKRSPPLTRTVPIRPELMGALSDWMRKRQAAGSLLVFPFWDGSADTLRKTTGKLSQRFASTFAYAGLEDITEHDLRHEACCRWYEMRNASGGWLFRTEQIPTLMGWGPGSPMPERYASFRGEDMAAEMYRDMAPIYQITRNAG